ncbi:MAG: hypothetical protein F6K18_14625 [Okeania sp. SIO2C2]|uniref:hypothetical protein n=1 Tax=Okeania sp. SIO2C2 TaxID=2607787 RepID=UPI0013B603BD|nr:hypothetical protein [Okeania sp. SIO2C2]NEP87954.1 hypothetical protein [Okeania sp. SIO2C2]
MTRHYWTNTPKDVGWVVACTPSSGKAVLAELIRRINPTKPYCWVSVPQPNLRLPSVGANGIRPPQ